MSTNIISPSQIPSSAKKIMILNEFGQELFSGIQIIKVNSIGDLKAQINLVVVVDEQGNSVYI